MKENEFYMKKYLLWLVLALPSLVASAQNEKNIVYDDHVQVRKMTGFNSIEVSGAINLFLSQGNEEAVAVSAGDQELLERIKTEVRDNVLYIRFDGKGLSWNRNWQNNKIKAYVTFTNLKKLEASGASNIKITNQLKLSDFKVELSGASDITGEGSFTNLQLSLSGASECKLSGSSDKANIICSGASSIKAYDLKCENAKVDVSGAASVRITVNKEISARASGASSIAYKGAAMMKDISSSGASSVKHRADD